MRPEPDPVPVRSVNEERRAICDYEGSTYQHDFWERGGREYEDGAEAFALRRLLPPAGKLLLEIGAGAGRNTPRYTGFGRVVLLDYSRTQLQQAQARLGRSHRYVYVAADAYRLPFVSGLFDAATMIRAIHHMADAPAALWQVRAVLKPGGAFVLEFASKLHLKSIARWLVRRQSVTTPILPDLMEDVAIHVVRMADERLHRLSPWSPAVHHAAQLRQRHPHDRRRGIGLEIQENRATAPSTLCQDPFAVIDNDGGRPYHVAVRINFRCRHRRRIRHG